MPWRISYTGTGTDARHPRYYRDPRVAALREALRGGADPSATQVADEHQVSLSTARRLLRAAQAADATPAD